MLDALDRLSIAIVAITASAVQRSAGSEVTFLAWRCLVVLGEHADPMRLGELAAALGLSAPSATRLTQRLARRALVVLEPDPNDGRGRLVRLAPEGDRVRAEVLAHGRAEMARALGTAPIPAAVASTIDRLAASLAAGGSEPA